MPAYPNRSEAVGPFSAFKQATAPRLRVRTRQGRRRHLGLSWASQHPAHGPLRTLVRAEDSSCRPTPIATLIRSAPPVFLWSLLRAFLSPAACFLGEGRFGRAVWPSQVCCCGFSETDSWLISVGELDAGRLKGALNHVERCPPRLAYSRLQLMHGHDPYASLLSKLVLAPSEQSPRCSALSRGKHSRNVPKVGDSHNSIKISLTPPRA